MMRNNARLAEEVPKFAADRMLIRLVRWLRLMGADVLCDQALSGAEVLRLARDQARPLLTRDKRLRTASDVLYIESHLFRDQVREVMARYPFDPHQYAFTRCSSCNHLLKRVGREAVVRSVPLFIYAAHENFAICEHCNRVHWNASHVERAMCEIEALITGRPQRTAPHG